jgi:hypothetical protein
MAGNRESLCISKQTIKQRTLEIKNAGLNLLGVFSSTEAQVQKEIKMRPWAMYDNCLHAYVFFAHSYHAIILAILQRFFTILFRFATMIIARCRIHTSSLHGNLLLVFIFFIFLFSPHSSHDETDCEWK